MGNKPLWIFVYCAAVLCISCGVMFGPDDVASGEYGTITLAGMGGRLAAPSGSPLDFAAFSEYRLTVQRSGAVVASAVARAGGTLSVTVEIGTGYTLEVYALVDQANQNNRSFAKSYKGVSDPFNLTAAGASVPVSLSLYEAAPVEVKYDGIGNPNRPYTIGGISFSSGDLYGLDFDRYGRLLINSSSDQLIVVEKGGSTAESYFLNSGGLEIAYNALTNSVFTMDDTNFYRYDLAEIDQTATLNQPVNTLVAPNMSSGETITAAAIDSAGSIYYAVYSASTPTAGEEEQMIEIRKASLSGQSLSPDSFFSSSSTKLTSSSFIEVKDIKAVMGRVVVVTLNTIHDTRSPGSLWVNMYDAANGAKIGETLSIPTGYDGSGGLHLITGWDEGGVWLYTQSYNINGNFVADEHYYITWNGSVTPQLVDHMIYHIGDTGPAGGLIFYDKGYFSDGWRYLEAAPKEKEFTGKDWGANGTDVGSTETGIGTGEENTRIIMMYLNSLPIAVPPAENETNRAASLCNSLTYGGQSDWFLPSKDELNLMYENLCAQGLGGFTATKYWSSSQYDKDFVWAQDFSDGSQTGSEQKANTYSVRAIWAF